MDKELNLALFMDFENIALGVKESKYPKFNVQLVVERLLEKGKLIVKRAYADWSRYKDYKTELHEAAMELIEVPLRRQAGKNSADIRLCVDAMDLCFSKDHVDVFVIASGDSDFSPLVSKLRENNKHVIGVGVKHTVSDLLVDNCDEFIYYEDLMREVPRVAARSDVPKNKVQCFDLLVDAILALMRESYEVLWGSMVKQAMKRKRPGFAESYYGYTTFSQLLEDAARYGVIGLRKDARSGTYVVTGLGADAARASAIAVGDKANGDKAAGADGPGTAQANAGAARGSSSRRSGRPRRSRRRTTTTPGEQEQMPAAPASGGGSEGGASGGENESS